MSDPTAELSVDAISLDEHEAEQAAKKSAKNRKKKLARRNKAKNAARVREVETVPEPEPTISIPVEKPKEVIFDMRPMPLVFSYEAMYEPKSTIQTVFKKELAQITPQTTRIVILNNKYQKPPKKDSYLEWTWPNQHLVLAICKYVTTHPAAQNVVELELDGVTVGMEKLVKDVLVGVKTSKKQFRVVFKDFTMLVWVPCLYIGYGPIFGWAPKTSNQTSMLPIGVGVLEFPLVGDDARFQKSQEKLESLVTPLTERQLASLVEDMKKNLRARKKVMAVSLGGREDGLQLDSRSPDLGISSMSSAMQHRLQAFSDFYRDDYADLHQKKLVTWILG